MADPKFEQDRSDEASEESIAIFPPASVLLNPLILNSIMPVIPAGVQGGPRRRAPTAFDKWKMGAMLGGSVGLVMGFLWGGVTIVRYGGGPDGPLRLLSKYMLGSGVTFGFFMSIGSVIRTEGPSPRGISAWESARRRPMIMQRIQNKKMEERRAA